MNMFTGKKQRELAPTFTGKTESKENRKDVEKRKSQEHAVVEELSVGRDGERRNPREIRKTMQGDGWRQE